jgi:hypothetical protein
MTKTDAPVMAAQLNALTEVYERKPVSLKAVDVWFDTLKEFPTERVMDVLNYWAKTHSKFPAPADVWKAVNEICIVDRERKALAEARENKRDFHPGVGGEMAEHFIAKIRETLKGPKWTPLEHWRHLFDTAPEGSIGKRYAEEVLVAKGADLTREPGQDDEERRAA